jgi:hypothetical protein
MSYYTYNVENHKMFISAKESAFRTNSHGADTANEAGDTFYPLGLQLTRIPRFYLRRNKVQTALAGFVDWGYCARQGYEIGTMTLSGEIKDFSQMYFFLGSTTTDGTYNADTVASGQGTSTITMTASTTIALNALAGLKGTFTGSTTEYTISSNTASSGSAVQITLGTNSPADANGKTFTLSAHSHQFLTTTARPSTPPSFQLLYKLVNDTGAESSWTLFVGCIITQVELTAAKNSPWTATFTIEFANAIAGVALTSEPDPRSLENIHIDRTVISITHATTAYQCFVNSFSITIVTGFYLQKAAGEIRAGRALRRMRDFKLRMDIVAMEKIVLTDFEDTDPTATTTDLDVTLTYTRVTSYDTLTFAFEKVWAIGVSYDWAENDYHLQGAVEFMIKPTTFETGAKLTITEINSLDDDRYET